MRIGGPIAGPYGEPIGDLAVENLHTMGKISPTPSPLNEATFAVEEVGMAYLLLIHDGYATVEKFPNRPEIPSR